MLPLLPSNPTQQIFTAWIEVHVLSSLLFSPVFPPLSFVVSGLLIVRLSSTPLISIFSRLPPSHSSCNFQSSPGEPSKLLALIGETPQDSIRALTTSLTLQIFFELDFFLFLYNVFYHFPILSYFPPRLLTLRIVLVVNFIPSS